MNPWDEVMLLTAQVMCNECHTGREIHGGGLGAMNKAIGLTGKMNRVSGFITRRQEEMSQWRTAKWSLWEH